MNELSRLSDRQLIEVGTLLRKARGLSGFGRDAARMNKADKVTYLQISYSTAKLEEAMNVVLRMKQQATPNDPNLPTVTWQAPQAQQANASAEGEGEGTESQDEGQSEDEEDESPDDILGKRIGEAVRAIAKDEASKAPNYALDETVCELVDKVNALEAKPVAEPLVQRIELKLGEAPVVDVKEKHPLFPKVLALSALDQSIRPKIMLVGPAGCGKTTLAGHVAEALGRYYGDKSFSGGTTESAFFGVRVPGPGGAFVWQGTPFTHAYENGGVFLGDEGDAADANVLVAVNSAVGNGHMTIEGRIANNLDPIIRKHDDFVFILAANTFGTGADAQYVGRCQLDAAFLDRFTILPMDYDASLEARIMGVKAPRVKHWTPKADVTQEAIRADLAILHRWIGDVREHKDVKGLQRIVSTRMMQKAVALRAIGCDLAEIKGDLLAGWQPDEVGSLLYA